RMDSDIVFATSRPSPGSVNRPVVGKAEIDIYRPSNFFHPYPWELRLELAVMLSPVRKLFD
ncbi:MAG: hypothetical protein WCK90_03230, partial [archaeon]